jgi:hypothetical protein
MSQDTPNPFALPGMSASFMNSPNNPLLTSMDMMRQAMSTMGYGGKASGAAEMVNPMSPEDLERRISDLRTVENWLKLNLSMLSSTIQGMEVQLATVKTIQSFVAMGQSGQTDDVNAASPLEIALGLKPAPNKPRAAASKASTVAPNDPQADAGAPANQQQAAAQGWWNMLEGQFAQIAAATANAAKMSHDALNQTTTADKPKSPAAPKTPASKRPAKKAAKSTRTTKTTK